MNCKNLFSSWRCIGLGLLMSSQLWACPVKRPVMFAGLDWDSNRFHNAVARYILEKGYGCKTDELPGSTVPMLAGLVKGDLDIMMEVWSLNLGDSWTKEVERKKVASVGINFADAEQGWYVPRYLVEGDAKRGIKAKAPGLKSVQDLKKYKELFKDPEEPAKGRFHNCILGWGCEKNNTKKLAAYKLEADFVNFRPGTGAALDSAIASAYKRGKPFVTYYWSPTWIMGKYDLVKLEEPAYDAKKWDNFINNNKMAQVTAYPTTGVELGVHYDFLAEAPVIVEFLKKYRTNAAIVNKALAQLKDDKKATFETAAQDFLRNQSTVWHKWVPKDVAQKVDAALKGQS